MLLVTSMAAIVVQSTVPGLVPLDRRWELSGEGTRIERYQGREALRIRSGSAVNRAASLKDGTIEFDVEVTPHRSFVYLLFRVTADGEHEEIYLRPHKSSLPDAIQYSPVWNGESNWQLYHGAGATAAVRFTHRQWMHVRLVLQGPRAALFVGGGDEPDLLIPLARETKAGHLGFRSSTPPGGAPPGETVAAFSNLVVRPDHVPYRFPPDSVAEPGAGLIRAWQLSSAFAADTAPVTRLPDGLLAGKTRWPAFPVEPNGVVVIGRYLARPQDLSATIGRLVLHAPAPGLQRLELGYSDYVTLFLDGRPIFAADAHYSHDRPRQDGLIGLHQATVWLPLRAGENEVLLAVADGFGGWGLMARLDPAGGVRVVEPSR